eukprot:scaffold3428_cov379-Prasinococcus_capsulatus_cf.AAC.9
MWQHQRVHTRSRRAAPLTTGSDAVGLLEEGKSALQGIHKLVHVLLAIVKVQRGARRGVEPQLAMQRLRTVVPGSNRHATLVQNHRQICRMHLIVVKGHQGRSLLHILRVWTQDAQTFNLRRALIEIGTQGLLLRMNLVHSHLRQIVTRCPQRHRFRNGGGARLKAQRRLRIRAVVEVDVLDHLATSHPRWHLLENFKLSPQKANTGGRTHLMARCNDPVGPERLHVHGHVRN